MASDNNKDQERLNIELLECIYRTSKKTVQEYVREIERWNRFKSIQHMVIDGTVVDDRSRLIDLYDACLQQDAHLASTIETLYSQILGERYMLASINDKGKYVKDVDESKKIQGTQFIKIIKGIVEADLFGYTGIEINPQVNELTGRLKEVNLIERRNILPDQKRIVRRQGIWLPNWSFEAEQYRNNYILINTGSLGLFSATTPLILAKKFTLANYVNFSHTYGQPIIHGKVASDNKQDRQRLANEIASAAQNRVVVTGLEDEVDIKTFPASNSERIFAGLIEQVNREVSNIVLGSESMAGETQSYVGATRAHQDIFRDRVEVYRERVENIMNEEVIPRLVAMGYIKPNLYFKYSKRLEMSNKEQIDLYNMLLSHYEVDADEIEKVFGANVGKQLDGIGGVSGGSSGSGWEGEPGRRHISDEEYFRRYGHRRGETVNFLKGRR